MPGSRLTLHARARCPVLCRFSLSNRLILLLLLAKEVATLDHFSGGRFLFGIGAGWLKEETEIMGGDFAHRWTQTQEAVMAMKALWTQEEAEYHGRYYDFPPVRSFPKPAQKPHPPIVLGSITSAQALFACVAQYLWAAAHWQRWGPAHGIALIDPTCAEQEVKTGG